MASMKQCIFAGFFALRFIFPCLAMQKENESEGELRTGSQTTISSNINFIEEESTFEANLQDPSRLRQTLIAAGIDPNDDNLFSRFMDPQSLHNRLVANLHGAVLDLSSTAFTTQSSLLILDALRSTKSVQHLNLTNCRFTPSAYFTLLGALSVNSSLRTLDLKQCSWPEESFTQLGVVFRENKYIEELILPDLSFKEPEIKDIYKYMGDNKSLSYILWPQKSIPIIRSLANENKVAMIHMGSLYAHSKIETKNEQQSFEEALKYFEKAAAQNHPLGWYEKGRVFQKQGKIEEALDSYRHAADLGNAAAQFILAEYYRALWPRENPLLEAPDYAEEYKWCFKSAQQQFPAALYRLGRMHEAGRFVPQSLTQAGEYFYEALVRGYPKAFSALGALCNNEGYEYWNEELAKYYLAWAKKFPETASVADRLQRNNREG